MMMRDFHNLTVIPGVWSVVLNGEAYTCAPFEMADVQGSVRIVPADRVLAIHWYGDHRHGSVEGFGAMEGFSDKSQLGNYVSAWLRARLKAKAEKVDAILRQQTHMDEAIATNQAAADSVRGEIDGLNANADKDRIILSQRTLDGLVAMVDKMRSQRPTDAQVVAAMAELDVARREVDAGA
jgi:hypothetical protein